MECFFNMRLISWKRSCGSETIVPSCYHPCHLPSPCLPHPLPFYPPPLSPSCCPCPFVLLSSVLFPSCSFPLVSFLPLSPKHFCRTDKFQTYFSLEVSLLHHLSYWTSWRTWRAMMWLTRTVLKRTRSMTSVMTRRCLPRLGTFLFSADDLGSLVLSILGLIQILAAARSGDQEASVYMNPPVPSRGDTDKDSGTGCFFSFYCSYSWYGAIGVWCRKFP
jgi:hypothetical protein